MRNRKTPALFAAAGILLAGIAGAAPYTNILFLCIDDLKPELGCYGFRQMHTPRIDRLAESGTLFLHHYVQQAVCAPSRMSMFTGMYPDSTRVWDLKTFLLDVRPDAVTVQQYFRQHGYQTAGCGKVMHGTRNEHPPSWSIPFRFDAALPYNKQYGVPALEQYQSSRIHKAVAELEKAGIKGYRARNRWLAERGARPPWECLDVPDDAYPDGAMAVWASDMLERFAREKKPFFLTVGFHKPHLPFVAPKKYWDLYNPADISLAPFRKHAAGSPDFAYHSWGELRAYSGIPKKGPLSDEQARRLIHAYFACVSYVDAQVGKVLDTLHRTGLDTNTVVVLWGDHGWHLGDHGLWCKHSNFEQATRSPLIIRVPGIPGGRRVESIVGSVDILPTLCRLAGLPIPSSAEGRSLVPLLRGEKRAVRDFIVGQYPRTWKKTMGYSVRTERYRLVVWLPEEVKNTARFEPGKALAVELYDYRKDPLETRNRAADPEYAPIVEDLENKLADFFKRRRGKSAPPDHPPSGRSSKKAAHSASKPAH